MSCSDAPATLLIIDDNKEVLSLMTSIFQREGYRTFAASDSTGSIAIAQKETPDLILLDLKMPRLSGLEICQSLKSNPDTHDIAVIFVSAITDTQIKSKGFSLGAADYISKPFRFPELLARVRAQLRLKSQFDQLRRQRKELGEKLDRSLVISGEVVDQDCLQRETKELCFDSDIGRVQGIVNQLLIGIGSRLSAKDRKDLALGLHEILLNAIEHGNLGIDSEEKRIALEDNLYNQLLEERQSDPDRRRKKVFVKYAFEDGNATYHVRDEGRGFDWRPFMERDKPEDLLASNGRGIMISRFIFDSVVYSTLGNEVRLEKLLADSPVTEPVPSV